MPVKRKPDQSIIEALNKNGFDVHRINSHEVHDENLAESK